MARSAGQFRHVLYQGCYPIIAAELLPPVPGRSHYRENHHLGSLDPLARQY